MFRVSSFDDLMKYWSMKMPNVKIYFSSGVCQCGRQYDWHSHLSVMGAKEGKKKWNSEKHTDAIEADTFGTIQFNGFGTENTRFSPVRHMDFY